jgi:hypothetical protein
MPPAAFPVTRGPAMRGRHRSITSLRRLRPWPAQPALLGAVGLVIAAAGCSTRPAATGPEWFRDVAAARGLDVVNDPGPPGSHFMPQSMGNGAAFLDYDRDGRLDILLLGGAGPQGKGTHRLFRQEAGGRFADVTAGSGLDIAAFGSGVAVGDVDDDGFPDLCLTEYGGLRLLRNDAGRTFCDVTAAAGLVGTGWGTAASFLDYDRDGRLDLVLANYVVYDPGRSCHAPDGRREFCGPKDFPGAPAALWHNVGTAGTVRFEDASVASGLAERPGAGLGILCADFDADGWDDIFVANDQQPNRLWINRHDGTFADEAVIRGVAVDALGRAAANMGIAWGDVDGDGLADLFVTHLDLETHTLWRQGPPGAFLDHSAAAGLVGLRRSTGFGTVLADFDLDGDLDLALVNGDILAGPPASAPGLPPFWRPYAQPNDLLANDGSGRFASIAAANPALCGQPNVARPLCAGDIDADGDVDLLVGVTAGRPLLLENVAMRRGHWLAVRALVRADGRDALGAVVTVTAGDRRWQRLVQPSASYLSSHDPRCHFGVGDATAIDGIEIRWPDGRSERFAGGPVDRQVDLVQGTGEGP